jgi:hypothetical protein
MKITRKQLRRLIAEALDEGRRIIVDPQGEAFVASDAYQTGTAKDAQTTHPKLMTLRQSGLAGQRQARQLAVDLDMQPELTAGEETAVEMGQQKAMAPDLKFHNELTGEKSIELSKYIKRECQKRGFVCSVKDTRHKSADARIGTRANSPFIVVTINGEHPIRYEPIDGIAYISDKWTGGVEIEMRAYYPDAPVGVNRARSGVLTDRNTAPYISGAPGYGGLEALAELVVDAISEL